MRACPTARPGAGRGPRASSGRLLTRTALCARADRGGCRPLRPPRRRPRRVVSGNLKYDVPPPPAEPHAYNDLMRPHRSAPGLGRGLDPCGRGDVCCSTCTTPSGARWPDLLTIVVPRQPGRGFAMGDGERRPGCRGRAADATRRAGRAHRLLCRRHDRRTRAVLPDRRPRVRGQVAGRRRRPEPDRGRQARQRHPAWPPGGQFRRGLRGSRRGRRRPRGRRRRGPREGGLGAAGRPGPAAPMARNAARADGAHGRRHGADDGGDRAAAAAPAAS